MRYNLAKLDELKAAFEYVTELGGRHAIVDIKRVQRNRTLRQNKFFYLLINYFASQTGYTAEEAKEIVKKYAAPSVFKYEKNGMTFYKSSADLDTAQMTKAIDEFRAYASLEANVELPQAIDDNLLIYMSNEIERNKNYL